MELLRFVGGILVPCALAGLGVGWGWQRRHSPQAWVRKQAYYWLLLTPVVLLGYLYCLL